MSKEQMQLGKEALEKQLADKKTRWEKISDNVPEWVGWLSLAILSIIPAIEHTKNPEQPLENVVSKMIYVGFVLVWINIFVYSFFLLDIVSPDYFEYKERLEKLLQDEKLRADIERELAKTAPMMQYMMRNISEEYPETGKKMLENNLSEQDSKLILEFMRAYMKAHPKDARQFVNLMAAAQMPQDLIDRFIAEYVSDTISFNMAQGLMDKQKD